MVCKNAMEFLGSLSVCLGCAFFTIKKTKIKVFAPNRDVRLPFAGGVVPRNTLMPRVVVHRFHAVKTILLMRNFSKIYQSVVGPVAVNVIYLTKWPLAVVHCPRNSVRRNYHSIDANLDVSIAQSPSFFARSCPSCCMLPQEIAALFAVGKPLMKKTDRSFAHTDRIPPLLNEVKYGVA